MLSYSTKGSAVAPGTEKIAAAAALARQQAQARHLEVEIDGELQIDAALLPAAAMRAFGAVEPPRSGRTSTVKTDPISFAVHPVAASRQGGLRALRIRPRPEAGRPAGPPDPCLKHRITPPDFGLRHALRRPENHAGQPVFCGSSRGGTGLGAAGSAGSTCSR
jgi:hypothetical protein